VEGGARLLAAVVRDLDAAGVQLDDLSLHRPTLDDVFLALTGHAAEPIDEERPEGRDGKEKA
jgi:ABC-2 type transport system ATP-binding protein